MAIKKSQIEKWIVAQKKHRLSDTHVQMARELGLNPDKLGKHNVGTVRSVLSAVREIVCLPPA